MTELIIIKTDKGQRVKTLLEKEHISYETYQEPKQDWEVLEKKALQEWENMSDEELISEWENLSDNKNDRTDNWS